MSVFKRLSQFAAIVALGVAMTLPAVDFAEARKGGSMGSRGSRTQMAPAATPTAPTANQPIQRTTTPQAQPGAAANAAQAGRGGMFGAGMGGALMRGLLIGGLVGMLFGGGLGGMAGMLGLLLQIALIGGAIYLAMRFFASRRQQTAAAGAGAGNYARSSGPNPNQNGYARDMQGNAGATGPMGGMGAGMGAATGAAAAQQRPAERKDEIGIKPADFDAFERTLGEVQAAYSREDRNKLGELVTPEMLGYFEQEFRDNAERGVRNQVNDVKLLQGDLAEAWREGQFEYATVAIRYAARDTMRDRHTGALADGSTDELGESTEVWTFIRMRGQPWKLSAIQ
ncbi:Tim44 domain-containing protein [Xanthobacteraceae bacterium A53D]